MLAASTVLALGGTIGLLASEWTYIGRLRHFSGGRPTPVEWFEPKETVAGVGAAARLSTVDSGAARVSADALAKAADYAMSGHASSFLVVEDGRIVEERYASGHGSESWTDSASMMKSITALLVGIAIADGRIRSLDEPASTYLDEWSRDARRKISIKNLLQMHSGLRPDGEYDDPFSDACYLALGTDLDAVIRRIPLESEPGVRFDYNNANYQALGVVLERATGRRFADYLSEKLWRPLGNADAAVWLDRPGGRVRTFGYLFAGAHDWARVGQLFVDDGRIGGAQLVPAEWIRFMRTPSPTEAQYGAGIYIQAEAPADHPFAAADTVVLNGRHKQRVYVVPSSRLVIVRVGPPIKVRPWDDSLLPNLIVGAHGK